MGYYAYGSGFIVFKETVSTERYENIKDVLSEILEIDGVRDPNMMGYEPHKTYFDIWDNGRYDRNKVLYGLEKIADISQIQEGNIVYHGEDDSIWRFVYKGNKWIEENGYVIFYDEEKVRKMKDHAFYSLLGLACDNMPDCGDDEYVNECQKIYRDALEQYKEAENIANNGI